MGNFPVRSKESSFVVWRICLKYLGHRMFPWSFTWRKKFAQSQRVQMASRETEMKTHPKPEILLSSDRKGTVWHHLRGSVDLGLPQ